MLDVNLHFSTQRGEGLMANRLEGEGGGGEGGGGGVSVAWSVLSGDHEFGCVLLLYKAYFIHRKNKVAKLLLLQMEL